MSTSPRDRHELRRAVDAAERERPRPAALDRLGLAAGLQALAADESWPPIEIDIAVDLDFEAGRHPARLLPDLELSVFRIVQEALVNAARHAGARHATATVEEAAGRLTVEIVDDGAGFDPATVTRGAGLTGTEERAQLLDGKLELRAAAGEGTRIRVTLPATHRAPADPPAGSPASA